MTNPTIPFGYKVVTGYLQKGDGLWDGARFRKVKKEYPRVGDGQVAIRRCTVEQVPLFPVEFENPELGDEG